MTNILGNLIITTSLPICLPVWNIFLRVGRNTIINMIINMMHVLCRLVMCLFNTQHLKSIAPFLMTANLNLKAQAMEILLGS